MTLGYTAAYRSGITPWERPRRARGSQIDALLAREEAERGAPPYGRAVDLGCGTGPQTRRLVDRGWDAVGIDNVRQAVDIAERRSGLDATRFVIGDARHLVHSGIGSDFSLVLDTGCFHGLGETDRALLAAGVTALTRPDATALILAIEPSRWPLLPRGATQADIERAFATWSVVSVENADTTARRGPLKNSTARWYRLRRN